MPLQQLLYSFVTNVAFFFFWGGCLLGGGGGEGLAVAFDEDFEAELSENSEARIEVSLLAQSPDREFTEVIQNAPPLVTMVAL